MSWKWSEVERAHERASLMPATDLEIDCIAMANRLLSVAEPKTPRHPHAYARGLRLMAAAEEFNDWGRSWNCWLALRSFRFAQAPREIIESALACMMVWQQYADPMRSLESLCLACFGACPVDWSYDWMEEHFHPPKPKAPDSKEPEQDPEWFVQLLTELKADINRDKAERAAEQTERERLEALKPPRPSFNLAGIKADHDMMLRMHIDETLPRRTRQWAGSNFHRISWAYGVGDYASLAEYRDWIEKQG